MATRLFIREGKCAFVDQGGEGLGFEKGQKPGPVDVLEVAASGCIGLCIVSYLKEKGIANPFHNISLRVSGGKIKITCSCDPAFQEAFQALVDDCYVLQNLKLEKEILFK